jgi:hypothetical protein
MGAGLSPAVFTGCKAVLRAGATPWLRWGDNQQHAGPLFFGKEHTCLKSTGSSSRLPCSTMRK